MLDKPAAPLRERLAASPREVLATLPAIGRLMVTAKHLGATHERIGEVEGLAFADGWAVLSGACHESRIELAAIAEIVVDRTSIMGGNAYPRFDLLRADGSYIAGIVGFGGLAPFDAALLPLGPGLALEVKPAPPREERPEVAVLDPGREPFDRALAAGAPVVIGFRRPGFEQAWRGRIETVNPAMGFINVMRPDFHLHLKAGAVAAWRSDLRAGELVAVDADGAELGLWVSAPLD